MSLRVPSGPGGRNPATETEEEGQGLPGVAQLSRGFLSQPLSGSMKFQALLVAKPVSFHSSNSNSPQIKCHVQQVTDSSSGSTDEDLSHSSGWGRAGPGKPRSTSGKLKARLTAPGGKGVHGGFPGAGHMSMPGLQEFFKLYTIYKFSVITCACYLIQ